MNLQERFTGVKKAIMERDFGHLNSDQREAVFTTEGPLLILAGAGSGKTTVLINRIACLLKYGGAYHTEFLPAGMSELDVEYLESYARNPEGGQEHIVRGMIAYNPPAPWSILAITFTNKAANELKDRLHRMLGEDGRRVVCGTFHSICGRILRSDIEPLGYTRDFTIYDTDDSKRVIKECIRSLGLNDKEFPPMSILSMMGRAKDSLLDAKAFAAEAGADRRLKSIAKVFAAYEKRLKEANALDFDDMISVTVRLFEQYPEVLEKYQKRFGYTVVDEFQDTNKSQNRLVTMLAGKRRNICVVGDDDQSIYKFRGATIENILTFEQVYPDAKVIRLEQNYRSTEVILRAANSAIKLNKGRKGKTLWTDREGGEKVTVMMADDEYAEGLFIADRILDGVASGAEYSDFAILYRTNAQSSAIEDALARSGIPYKVYGGMRFMDRKEVKDVVAYLCLINNPSDDLRLRRIINEPKRGIGGATVEIIEAIAGSVGLSMFEIVEMSGKYPELQRMSARLLAFAAMIKGFREHRESVLPADLARMVLDQTGYLEYIKSQDTADGRDRAENVMTLISNIQNYEENAENPTLAGFLEEAALASELDSLGEGEAHVSLMTMHSAKGLEFRTVFLAGWEDGLFPSSQSRFDPAELEEERRLSYVAITRARDRLFISYASKRRIFGQTKYSRQSLFLDELPEDTLERVDRPEKSATGGWSVTRGREESYLEREIRSRVAARDVPSRSADEYFEGERVSHNVFGEGTIVSARKVGGDHMLEIEFEKVGKKKIMANYAKLTKLG